MFGAGWIHSAGNWDCTLLLISCSMLLCKTVQGCCAAARIGQPHNRAIHDEMIVESLCKSSATCYKSPSGTDTHHAATPNNLHMYIYLLLHLVHVSVHQTVDPNTAMAPLSCSPPVPTPPTPPPGIGRGMNSGGENNPLLPLCRLKKL